MTCVSPRSLVVLIVALALSPVLSACSGGSADGSVGTSGQADAFVALDTASGPFVVVENRTEQPLVDVNVAIKSGMIPYSASVSRLEAKEKRQIRHGDFTSRDGTAFNLRVARPGEITVTARDLGGKQFETTLDWD
jgi:hypothetical protein